MSDYKRRSRCDGSITPEMCRAHAKKRLRERYQVEPTDEFIRIIELRIRSSAGNTWRLYNQYWAKSVWRVQLMNEVFFVVYDEYLRCVLTFLTKAWVQRNRPGLIC